MPEQVEIIYCPICGEVIHEHFAGPVEWRASVPSRSSPERVSQMMQAMWEASEAEQRRLLQAAEAACRNHYLLSHRRRLRLYERFGWRKALTWRWPGRTRFYEAPALPGRHQVISPVKFITGEDG